LQKDIKSRDEKVAGAQEEVNAAREQLNGAAGKGKELNDKLKQKNVQLAQLGKERGELVQELAKARQIIAKVGGAEEAAAAVEEQNRATQASQERITQLEGELAKARDAASVIGGKLDSSEATLNDLRQQLGDAEAQVEALHSEMRVAATGNQLRGDWEARFRSAADERDDLKKLVSRMRIDLLQAREAAARSGGGTSGVDEGLLRLVGARADVHET